MIFVVFPGPGDNAFDLVRRHVLGFVDDEVCLFQGAAADEIESFCLDELAVEDFLDFSIFFSIPAEHIESVKKGQILLQFLINTHRLHH